MARLVRWNRASMALARRASSGVEQAVEGLRTSQACRRVSGAVCSTYASSHDQNFGSFVGPEAE